MTDRAAAAHRGMPRPSGTGAVGCGLARPLDGPVPGNLGIPSASAWCPGRRAPPSRSLSPLRAPGLTVSGFQSFHGPDIELQQDIHTINIRLIYKYRDAACGQFRVSPHAQARLALFPGKRPAPGVVRQRNPQHFHRACTGSVPLHTSHPHLCTQPAGKQPLARPAGKRPPCRAGSQQPVSAPVLAAMQPVGSGHGADEVVQEPGRGHSPPPWVWAPMMAVSAPAASGCSAAAWRPRLCSRP
jgi:hypothetical protein